MGTIENEEFCKILNTIRRNYGVEIAFDPKRLKNILSDLNLKYKKEENIFMSLIKDNQAFVRNVSNQTSVSEDAVIAEVENLCGLNHTWTENVTRSLFTIIGKRYDGSSHLWIDIECDDGGIDEQSISSGETSDFEELLRLAETGNKDAQLKVADKFYYGEETAQDYHKAFHWYKELSQTIDPYVWGQIGDAYYFGRGAEKDLEEAFHWYEKSAEKGRAYAQARVGACYYYGEGVSIDYKCAVDWLAKAAQNNSAWGMSLLADCYYYGRGTEKDLSKAFEWYEKSALAKRPYSMTRVGQCYYYGEGIGIDYEKALSWYNKAAAAGDAWALSLLGDYYYDGKASEKDLTEAVKWYTKAAEKNRSNSQARLGRCYYHGEGVPVDYEKALHWYKKAAENNDAWGMSLLGDYYYDGKAVEADYTTALGWYKKASAGGNAWAMKQLGLMYCNGYGVSCDYNAAIDYLEKAASKGNGKAKEVLVQLQRCLPVDGLDIEPMICARDIDNGAWGPERAGFSWEKPASYIVFNSIRNNPSLGDERNFVRVKRAGTDDKHRDSVDVANGNEYEIYIYYHNNISSSFYKKGEGIANDVRLSVTLPDRVEKGKTGIIRAAIHSKDAHPNLVWDTAYFKATEDLKIIYVEDSACIHNPGTADGSILPKENLFGTGALISFDIDKPGVIPSSEDGSRAYITLRVKCELDRVIRTINYDNGTVYEGETLNGKLDGFGKMSFYDGNVYEGYFACGKRNGKGKFTWKTGTYYDGLWVDDLREDDKGYQCYDDESVYEGGWKAGKRDGYGVQRWKDKSHYEGYWKEDQKCGQGKMIYANGNIYEGNWEQDVRHGEGTILLTGGALLKGVFKNGEASGKVTIKYKNDIEYKGAWSNESITGEGEFLLYDGPFSECRIRGNWNGGRPSARDIVVLYVKTKKGAAYEYHGGILSYKLSGGGSIYSYEKDRKEPIDNGVWERGKKKGSSSRLVKEAENQFGNALEYFREIMEKASLVDAL